MSLTQSITLSYRPDFDNKLQLLKSFQEQTESTPLNWSDYAF